MKTIAWLNRLTLECSAATVKAYRYEIEALRARFPDRLLADLLPDDVYLHLVSLPESRRYRAANALRSFFRFAGRGDLADLIPLRKPPQRGQRTLTPEQVMAVLMVCDTSTPIGRRDLALQALMIDSGLRAAEVCRLERSKLDLEAGLLRVVVKGGQEEF